jgi:uncharacterized sulfatase
MAEITFFDSQVGELVGMLDASPLRDNTLVIVLSEQGNSLPFAKWTCYDAGLHSACVVRWPGNVRPGSTSDALVEYVDVVPTLLEAAGAGVPGILDAWMKRQGDEGSATEMKALERMPRTEKKQPHG